MSLTGQLADGDLGRWCAATLTGTPRLAAEVTAAVGRTRPVRPRRFDDPRHWATIGGALGQRLAFAVQHAPPYYALLGAHRAGLADLVTVHAAAARFPTHTALPAAERGRANQLRPLPREGWLDLGPPALGAAQLMAPPSGLVTEFAARLVGFLATHTAPGRLADSRGAEAVLARACVVLTGWESAYRGGELPAGLADVHTDPATTVADLLAAVPDHQVDELVDLVALAHTRGVLRRLAPPTGSGGVAGPVFVEHWADGDLLIPATPDNDHARIEHGAAGEMVLLDVKTVASVRDPHRVARWLWQLLGYAWLDATDRYRIRAVGLYPARHGVLITWPLDRFVETLLDGRAVAANAAAFRRLAEHAYTQDAAPSAVPR